MKLSAPIYRLKRQAKALSRQQDIPLHEALDRLAVEEGFARWSLLAARASEYSPSSELFAGLDPGDLVLLGARPGHGKTQLGLELILEGLKSGSNGAFFTLEYGPHEVVSLCQSVGLDPAAYGSQFQVDTNDAISADYIIAQLASAPAGTIVVVDYLQLLDQRRENPELIVQVRTLKSFAAERGLVVVFISQIDRAFEASNRSTPDLQDVRLPNPVDLTLFSKTCFLNDGQVNVEATV